MCPVRVAKGAAKAILDTVDKAVIAIMAEVKTEAIRSIDFSKRSSNPGEPVNTQTGAYPTTIQGSYNKQTQTAIAGPTLGKGVNTFDGSTLPHGLEYGGTKTTPERYVPADAVAHKYRKAEVDRINKKRRRGKARAEWRQAFTLADLKYVLMPARQQVIEARPTMRLAFNKMATSENFQKHFEAIGIKQPQLIQIG